MDGYIVGLFTGETGPRKLGQGVRVVGMGGRELQVKRECETKGGDIGVVEDRVGEDGKAEQNEGGECEEESAEVDTGCERAC